jgi:hypothetical protein
MVTRKTFSFADQGWPGTKFARDDFGLAAAQWLLTPPPAPTATGASGSNLGIANLFPHFVNDDAWARRALAEFVPLGDAKLHDAKRGVPSAWTHEAILAALAPVAAPAVIPARADTGRWDLPGQIAWKQGSLYGLAFYGVPGNTTPAAACRIGGAPSALWSAGTGAFLLSSHNTHFEDNAPVGNNGVATLDDCTFACVAGHIDGALWTTGHERATLAWTTPDTAWVISGKAAQDPAPQVTWTYAVADNRLDLSIQVDQPDLADAVLNLPFLAEISGASVTPTATGSAICHLGNGDIAVTWDGGAAPVVTPPLPTGSRLATSYPVTCLRIPLLATAGGWGQKVAFTILH